MAARNSEKPSSESRPQVVTAPTLKEALRRVRDRYGPDARLVRSRSVKRPVGLGEERFIEVTVAAPPTRQATAGPDSFTPGYTASGTYPPAVAAAAGRTPLGQGETAGPAPHPIAAPTTVSAEIQREIARVEELVRDMVKPRRVAAISEATATHPLAASLLAAGTSSRTAALIMERYADDFAGSGDPVRDLRPIVAGELRTAGEDWQDLRGCHVILGNEGCGKSELVLAVAAKLQGRGTKTLVLNLLPRHAGDLRRLQHEASRHGYDAAIIKQTSQLEMIWSHLERYEVVLIDTPPWLHPSLTVAGDVQRLIGQNAALQRHLLVPLDGDISDTENLRPLVRDWCCDWLGLTRTERTRKPGKIFDIAESLGLPISFLTRGPWPARQVEIAGAGNLLRLIFPGEAQKDAGERRDAAEA
jgi:flagellar biosynthesis GTPase FlhF